MKLLLFFKAAGWSFFLLFLTQTQSSLNCIATSEPAAKVASDTSLKTQIYLGLIGSVSTVGTSLARFKSSEFISL